MIKKSEFIRNTEKYLVDYVKHIIKAREVDGIAKFRALLMVKEMLKTRQKILLDYVERKLLNRLCEYATSEFRASFMLQVDPTIDPKISADFYQLILECIDSWGAEHGVTNPAFLERRDKLTAQSILPISMKFSDILGPDKENEPVSITDSNIRSIEHTLDEVQMLREQLAGILLESKVKDSKIREVEQIFKAYSNAYVRMESYHDSKIRKSINIEDPKQEALKEDLLAEIGHYSKLKEIYEKNEDVQHTRDSCFENETGEINACGRNLFAKAQIRLDLDIDNNTNSGILDETTNSNGKGDITVVNQDIDIDSHKIDPINFKRRPADIYSPTDNYLRQNKDQRRAHDRKLDDKNIGTDRKDREKTEPFDMMPNEKRLNSCKKIESFDLRGKNGESINTLSRNGKPKFNYESRRDFKLLSKFKLFGNDDSNQVDKQNLHDDTRIVQDDYENEAKRSNTKTDQITLKSMGNRSTKDGSVFKNFVYRGDQIRLFQEKIREETDEDVNHFVNHEDQLDLRPRSPLVVRVRNQVRSNLRVINHLSQPKSVDMYREHKNRRELNGADFNDRM